MSGRIRNRNRSREATTHGLREAKARAKCEVSMSNVGVDGSRPIRSISMRYQCGGASKWGTGEKSERLYPAETKKSGEVEEWGTGEKNRRLYPEEAML